MKQLKYISTIFLALMLATALGCTSTKSTSTREPEKKTAGEYIDDAVITAKVKKDIFDEPSLKASEIKVETYKGVVQLSGFVSSEADIKRAVEVARNVKGVTSVKNDMRLKPRE